MTPSAPTARPRSPRSERPETRPSPTRSPLARRILHSALAITAPLLLTAGAVHAGTGLGTSIATVGGSVQEIPAPTTSLVGGVTTSSSKIYVFREQLNLVLAANVGVNISTAGTYGPAALTPALVLAGTPVTSYLVHFEPNTVGTTTLNGTIEFDQDILGIITGYTGLINTDLTLGLSTVSYEPTDPNRGIEFGGLTPDQIVWTGTRQLSITLSEVSGMDEMRILVLADGRGVSFSFDGQSASFGTGSSFGPTLNSGQVLTVGTGGPPGPNPPVATPAVPGVMISPPTLGLTTPMAGTLEMDALSYGRDSGSRLRFSVDEWAGGVAGLAAPDVRSEASSSEAAADVFGYQAPFAPPTTAGVTFGNRRIYDGAGGGGPLAIGLAEPDAAVMGIPDGGDNLDDLDLGTTPTDVSGWVLFSLDGSLSDTPEGVSGYGSAAANGFSGADILVNKRVLAPDPPLTPTIYASYADLGLMADDDIDALIVNDGDGGGSQDNVPTYAGAGGEDFIFFSLRRGSPSLMNPAVHDTRYGLMLTEADVLEPTATGVAIAIPGEAMGLLTERAGVGYLNGEPDDLDGMDLTYPLLSPGTEPDSAVVAPASFVFIDVLGNDSAPYDALNPASIRIVRQPQHGTLNLALIPLVSYHHDGSATTTDSFAYIVADSKGEVSEVTEVAISISGDVGVDPPGAGAPFAFRLVGRNPSSASTQFALGTAGGGRVRLEIYDAQGRRVRSLLDANLPAGSGQRVTWDGRDDAGRSAGAGLFFARFAAPEGVRTLRVVRLR